MLQQLARGSSWTNSLLDPETHAPQRGAGERPVAPTPRDSLIGESWAKLFTENVFPRLLELHAVRRDSSRKIWHADLDAGAKLARGLLAPSSSGISRYVDSLLEQGASLSALYHEVFEPAQLLLGKLRDADRCDDIRLAIGLARLQVQVRRVSVALPADHVCKPSSSVLLCPQPAESHSVGLVMSSELFDRSGWDVTCAFPGTDQTLVDVVRDHWFDVLKLSQSGSLRRDSRLLSMRDTIDAARFASQNPSLVVLVDGRTFAESPQIYRTVHADAVAFSVLDMVPVAQRLVEAGRSVAASVQVSAS